jgi:hypothetical protein
MVVYGDKNTPHLSVQLYRSESTGGTRKIKDLLAEELTFREHDDVHYSGVKLATRFITSDSEAKLVSDGVENLCGGRAITHLKSPPRSHRYSFIEGRMKALVSKALSAYHYPGYPLSFFLHSFVHTQWQPSTCSVLTTQVRGDEGGRYKTPFERRYGKLPHATDLYPFGAKVYTYPTEEERNKHSGRGRIAYYLHPQRLTPPLTLAVGP